MRCLHCGKELDEKEIVCPYCNHDITEETRQLNLPKYEEDDFVMGKTRAMSPIHDSELSLIDDINKEIENSTKVEEKKDEENIESNVRNVDVGEVSLINNDVNSVLRTKESLKKRKIILIVCILLTVLAVILTVLVVAKNDKTESVKINGEDYIETYNRALDKYYETGEIDDVVIVLQANKNDEERIDNIQRKTRITCDSWLLTYIEEKIEDKDTFEELTKNYEDFLYGLNNYAIATVGEKKYKALTDSDYLELTNQLSSVYEDGMIFFDALELYNKKDYNKAYTNFELVDSSNVYFDSAVYYKGQVVDNILKLLGNDIKKLEKGIDDLSIDEKISRYVAIEEIILKYNDAYVNVDLDKNDTYNTLLTDCRNKIDEYSKMSTNEESNE